MGKLQTDFKDDILDEEMDGKRRVRLTPLPDGTYIIEDVTKYTQTGSEYGQKEINQLNETVNEKLDSEKVIDDLNTALAVTENGVPVGCKAISELNSNMVKVEATGILSDLYLGTVDPDSVMCPKGIRLFYTTSPSVGLCLQMSTGITTAKQILVASGYLYWRSSSDGGKSWSTWFRIAGAAV